MKTCFCFSFDEMLFLKICFFVILFSFDWVNDKNAIQLLMGAVRAAKMKILFWIYKYSSGSNDNDVL